MMIKFCSSNDIHLMEGCVTCHSIEIDRFTTLRKGSIINEKSLNMLKNLTVERIIIVSDENTKKEDIKEFIINNFTDVFMKEFEYLNKRYSYILDDNFKLMLMEFFKISIMSLKAAYLIDLLTNPVVLKKSVDLCILSFYFSLKMKLTPREIEDVFYSSILCNLNLCKSNNFLDIEDEDFLINYKKSYNDSYELIKDDANLSNNVKRILLYFNDLNYSKTLYVDDNNNEILKDPTLEIIQLTNDLLTYSFQQNIRNLYSKKYTQIQPAISVFLKNVENKKHKNRLHNIRKKMRKLWLWK